MAGTIVEPSKAGNPWRDHFGSRRGKKTTRRTLDKKTDEKGGRGGGGCFSFGGTVQYIEESNIYLCFVVCRLKRGLVT